MPLAPPVCFNISVGAWEINGVRTQFFGDIMKVKSIEDVERFLSIQEQALGITNPEVAITVTRLGLLHFDENNLEKAQELFERALEILENASGPHRAGADDVRKHLERVRVKRRENERAGMRKGNILPNSRRTIQDTPLTLSMSGIPSVDAYFAKMSPPDRSTSSNSHNDQEELGLSYTDLSGSRDGKIKKVTESMITEAALEVNLLKQMVGVHNVAVADALTKLADLYCRKKMYKEMEPLLIEALKIREDALGDEHATVSTELKNLARVYMAQERFTVAEPLIKRAISIRTKSYGRNHRRTLDALDLYISLLRKTGRHEKADEITTRMQEFSNPTANPELVTDSDPYRLDTKVR